ncbi:Protein mmf1 [Penicillium waksmanii]|uniref:Protein mmf1 n=1 Tax=Penicillium waksmanii TaxID=69791 RepID=UPI0025478259|nr:Protein mmf1 [Penicillium waksmanii]KAJ5979955.1 Protein mmf1 [Penicillium waksmanii]
MSANFTAVTAQDACPRESRHPTSWSCPSQAIRANGTIYVSGQIPADASGNLVEGNIGTLTQACCNNIQAIVTAAGSSVGKIVKVNVFLTDMANFAEMNATYEKFFTHKPARSCVAVKQLPKGVPVEIECIALE